MKLHRILPLAGVSLLALNVAALAQDKPVVLDLVTIISEGRDNIEATGGTVLTEEDLETLKPADVSELFSRVSTVTVSGGGGPSKRIHVLGMEQSALAVSVDGVPQVATSWHHTGSNVIDPAFLKRVEVEAGAAAADAGFAAAAGAVRYETVSALDMLEDGRDMGGRASLSYGSNGRGFAGTLAGYGRARGFDWLVMLHGADGDDYENGDGTTILGTAPAALNLLTKFGYEFEDHRIELSYEKSRDDADRLIKMNMGLSGDELHPLKIDRETIKLSYTSTSPTANWDPEVMIYLSQQDYWRPDYAHPAPPRGGTNGDMILNEDLFGGKVQNTFDVGIGRITAGVDFGQHDYHIDNYGDYLEADGSFGPRYRNFSTSQVGTYVQGRFEFENGVSLSTGLRYDTQRFTDWNGERFSDSGTSANATLSYRVNDNIEVFAGASQTWLGYVIGDYGYIHARGDAFYTDPDFAPGEAENYKIGANFAGNSWNGGITFFDTQLRGFPNYDDPSLNNEPEYRSKGFTLNASYDFGATRVGATYTKADVTVDGVPAVPSSGMVMPVGDMATLFVDHEIAAWNAKVGASVQWAGSVQSGEAEAQNFYEEPSYTVVNAYAEWTPQSYENMTLRLSVDNLFDETYYERSGYAKRDARGGIEPVYAPGRTITFGGTVKF